MELSRASEWFDSSGGYIPQVGTDVILCALRTENGRLVMRFLDVLSFELDIELNVSDLNRVISFVNAQRYLSGNSKVSLKTTINSSTLSQADDKKSIVSDWFLYHPRHPSPTSKNVVDLTEILTKIDDRLSADLMNPENKEKEFYLLRFENEAQEALEILISRVDINRIIDYHQTLQALLNRGSNR